MKNLQILLAHGVEAIAIANNLIMANNENGTWTKFNISDDTKIIYKYFNVNCAKGLGIKNLNS